MVQIRILFTYYLVFIIILVSITILNISSQSIIGMKLVIPHFNATDLIFSCPSITASKPDVNDVMLHISEQFINPNKSALSRYDSVPALTANQVEWKNDHWL